MHTVSDAVKNGWLHNGKIENSMGPSTLAFLLRWQFVPAVGGVLAMGIGAYGLLTSGWRAPAALSFTPILVSQSASLALFVVGLLSLLYAWRKARALRLGSGGRGVGIGALYFVVWGAGALYLMRETLFGDLLWQAIRYYGYGQYVN